MERFVRFENKWQSLYNNVVSTLWERVLTRNGGMFYDYQTITGQSCYQNA